MDGSQALEDTALNQALGLLNAMRRDELEWSERKKPVGRHELSDKAWALVAPFLPSPKPLGRRPKPNRLMLNGMLWLLRTGAPWRDLPRDRFGPFTTVYTRFACWRRAGVFDRLVEGLLGMLNDKDEIDWDLWCVDGSVARAARCAGGYPKGGGHLTSRRTMPSVCPEVAPGRSSTSSPLGRGHRSLST